MMNTRNMRACRRAYFTLLVLLAAVALGFGTATSSATEGPQSPGNPGTQTQSQAEAGAASTETQDATVQQLTVWEILRMCDWLFWPFVLLTGAGLTILSFRALLEHQQRTRAQKLLLRPIEVTALSKFVKQLNASPTSRATRLFSQLITTFNKTKRAEPLHEDIKNYVHGLKDSFETFNRIMAFLSDTAGALGLLGTVWGIFVTFHAGDMDGEVILRGMSVALITTLVGLIISIVLNLGVTALFTLFNGQIKLLNDRAEELRQALLHLQAKAGPGGNGRAQMAEDTARRMRSPEMPPRFAEPRAMEEVEGWV